MGRAMGWLHRLVPTREQLEANRWVKPHAKHVLRSDLWRFNRRSVPRAIALGLFVGIMIPFAHFAAAAVLAVFVRANIPIALAATFVGFPAFLPVIWLIADRIGSWLLRIDALSVVAPVTQTIQAHDIDHLLAMLTHEGPAVAFGMFVMASVLAATGYLASSLFWRLRVGRKRVRRLAEAHIRQQA